MSLRQSPRNLVIPGWYAVMICMTAALITAATLPCLADTATDLPLAAGIQVKKAQALIRKGAIKKAATVLEAFKEKQKTANPENARKKGYSHYYIDFLLGNVYLMAVDGAASDAARSSLLNQAADAYADAVDKNRNLAPAWLNLAKCRYDLGRFQPAADAFEKGYEASDEKNPDHLYFAAVCRFQSNDLPKALSLFNRLIQTHPEAFTLERRQTLVSILLAAKKNRDALPHVKYLAAHHIGKKKKEWQEILLYQYMELGMEKQALDLGKTLTRTEPTEPKWWKGVSHLYLNRNDLKNGLCHLVIYSYLTEPAPEEVQLMADLYMALDAPAKASDLYADLLKDEESYARIQRIIQAFIAAHEPEKALTWIDRALALKNTFSLLKQKAGLLYELKRFDAAATAYEELIRRAKDPGAYYLMLGYCTWQADQTARARAAFRKASEFKKQKKAAFQAIRQLDQASG